MLGGCGMLCFRMCVWKAVGGGRKGKKAPEPKPPLIACDSLGWAVLGAGREAEEEGVEPEYGREGGCIELRLLLRGPGVEGAGEMPAFLEARWARRTEMKYGGFL